MRETESTPSLIENIAVQALKTVTTDEKGQQINFKDNREAASKVSEQLHEAGIMTLSEDVAGNPKTASVKVMVGGKEKLLELNFLFNQRNSQSSIKNIQFHDIN